MGIYRICLGGKKLMNALMLLVGFFLMSADSIPVIVIGLLLMIAAACREGAFYQKKKSCRCQAKQDKFK